MAGRKCARRAARGAPGVLCARSTSRMVVGKAPVAARGALRALKPRATPRWRGEGSVARACCCRVSWQVRGQIVVGHVKFCQCPASATKIHPSIARHGMGRPPYQWQWQCQWYPALAVAVAVPVPVAVAVLGSRGLSLIDSNLETVFTEYSRNLN